VVVIVVVMMLMVLLLRLLLRRLLLQMLQFQQRLTVQTFLFNHNFRLSEIWSWLSDGVHEQLCFRGVIEEKKS